MSYEVTKVECEVVDWLTLASTFPHWLKIDEAAAKAHFRQFENSDGLTTHPDGGFIMGGVRFWRTKTIAVR
jgi:hypothetical protein